MEESGGLDMSDSGTAPRRKAGPEGAQGRRGNWRRRDKLSTVLLPKKRREMGCKLPFLEVSKERADDRFLFYKTREQHVCKMMGKVWP